LGFKIFTSISFLRTELAFGGIVCIAIIGISFYSFISLMERKLIQWAE
jgi:ABC-type nitrate/sulfonate/bicarbonate transport system permease component